MTATYEMEYKISIMHTEQTPAVFVKPQTSLRAWRRSKGYTQTEAARFLEISQGYYNKLERKEQTPRPAILKVLTERTGVPVEELMGIAV